MIISSSTVSAQDKKEIIPTVENIYLHTDRNTYTLGESLWYKAYAVYPYNNQLYNKSDILHVELISPDKQIIAHHKTRIENGLGYGDFKLTDSSGIKKPGIYQLRAYTNWNRNFDKAFIFSKDITVLNVFNSPEVSGIAETNNKENSDSEADSKSFKVQFFPEGGSLVENVINIVALKALDSNGFPIEVKGEIYTTKDSLVTFFETIHDGMGTFQLNPKNGEQYYAKTSRVGAKEALKFPLPQAREMGFVLSSKPVKGNTSRILTVKTNKKTLASQQDQNINIICKIKDIIYFEINQPITSTIVKFELPQDKLPGGINHITLYDANNKPQSERLIFIDKSDKLEVTLSTNKQTYKPDEKVTVTVSSKTKAGTPELASYSLSSIDMNGMEDKGLDTNICSYFLVESDIRGQVYNPGFYFNNENPWRIEKLDLLLLTQGWRDFVWKDSSNITDNKLAFPAEKGINLSGQLTQVLSNKGKGGNNITLTLFNKGEIKMLNTVTDSLGHFKFENILFYGTSEIILSSKDNKGKSRGLLSLDDKTQSDLAVNFTPQSIKVDVSEDIILKNNVLEKYKSIGIMEENVLDEVEIIAPKKDEPLSMYGTADRSYVFGDEVETFLSIYDLIQTTLPSVVIEEPSIRFIRNAGPAMIIVDGIIWQPDELSFLQPADVVKIETLNGASATILGSNGGNGAILIYLKKGGTTNEKIVLQTVKENLEGLYEPRVFYAPDPTDITFENQKEDVRNTLYWNPFMHPDTTGIVEADYYNSAVETEIKVTIEGVTASGIPVVVKTRYTIEE
ncbi:hypothetical protein ACFFVB_11155 [Formosa undariae]|uniref:TonB-dependent receptor plug domain-containing protein n=1 Tax=Formosa undariae TaxID=1325436 RepID=A0ABV5F2F9_9FLAO